VFSLMPDNFIVFSLEVWPLRISMFDFEILKVFAKNSIKLSFALPSTGGAAIFILSLPSCKPTI